MPTSLSTSQPHTPGMVIHAESPLNNPEQIRTNLNAAKRLDQIGALSGSPRIRPIKTTPNKPSPTSALPRSPQVSRRAQTHSIPSFLRSSRHSCAGRNRPRSLRHSCAGRNWRAPTSFLRRQEPVRPLRHSCAGRNRGAPAVIPAQAGTGALQPSFLCRQEPARSNVIPAQAGTCARHGYLAAASTQLVLASLPSLPPPQFISPPFQGGD